MKDLRYSTQTTDVPACLQVPQLNFPRAEHDVKAKVFKAMLSLYCFFSLLTIVHCIIINSPQLLMVSFYLSTS